MAIWDGFWRSHGMVIVWSSDLIPSGKRLHNYGKSPFLMGKLTISMAIFNSYVKLPEGILHPSSQFQRHFLDTMGFPGFSICFSFFCFAKPRQGLKLAGAKRSKITRSPQKIFRGLLSCWWERLNHCPKGNCVLVQK